MQHIVRGDCLYRGMLIEILLLVEKSVLIYEKVLKSSLFNPFPKFDQIIRHQNFRYKDFLVEQTFLAPPHIFINKVVQFKSCGFISILMYTAGHYIQIFFSLL